MQDVVRVYEFTYKDGRKVLCITDLVNIVVFPESGRENRLVEYGRHGRVEDQFDYEIQPHYLELGDRALMRPIKEMDSYAVWPDLDHVPSVTNRFLLRIQDFDATIEKYRERLYAHRAERKHIEHSTEKAIESFRRDAIRDKKQRLKKLGNPPTFEELLQEQLSEG